VRSALSALLSLGYTYSLGETQLDSSTELNEVCSDLKGVEGDCSCSEECNCLLPLDVVF
jgi:hypothetical protein